METLHEPGSGQGEPNAKHAGSGHGVKFGVARVRRVGTEWGRRKERDQFLRQHVAGEKAVD